jgi:hypothetical protein
MRTPVGVRNFGIVLAVIGAGSVVYGAMHGNGKDTVSGFSIFIGITLFLLGAVTAISFMGEIRRYRKLTSGEGVLARWTVSAEEWVAFLTFNKGLEKGGRLRAILPSSKRRASAPVELIVAANALMIDGKYHELLNTTYYTTTGPHWEQGPPAYLEYHVKCDGPETSDWVEYTYRLPVREGADFSRIGLQARA